MSDTKPKMPHLIKKVCQQIETHAKFSELDENTIFAYRIARDGYSWATKQNNAWLRKLWQKLYLDWEIEI